MKETLKKLEGGVVEIQREVTNTETITVNPEVLDEDIRSAEAVVIQRESELASAQLNLQNLKDLSTKIKTAK
jgi:hypothetical protein